MAEAKGSLPNSSDNRSAGFIACLAITTFAALVTVCLRVYVRTRVIRMLGWDDYTAMFAMALALVTVGLNIVECVYGYGRHEVYLSKEQQIKTSEYNTFAVVTVVLSSCFSKISICLFVLRLLGDAVAKKRKLFLHACIGVLMIGNLLDIISLLVQCRPARKFWDREVSGTCWKPGVQQGFAYMQGGLSISTAFILSALPILIFRKLQMNLRTKVGLSLLMGLGVFDGICSIVRTSLLPGFNASMDYSYTSVPISIWATLEQNIAIIAACIPAIRPLFRYFDSSTKNSSKTRDRKGYTMQKERPGDTLVSKPNGIRDEEYGMTNLVSVEPTGTYFDDGSSAKSMLPLRNGTAIQKTTEVDVTR